MAKSNPIRRGSALFWVVGAVAVVLIFLGLRTLTRERIPVGVAPVTFQTIASTVSTNGKVEPVDEYQAHAASAGVIQKIDVNVGQHVVAGTLLIQMDDAEVKARIASANAALSAALLTLHDLNQGGSVEDRNRFSSDLAQTRAEQQQAAANLASVHALEQKGSASAGEVAAAQQRVSAADMASRSATQRATVRYDSADRRNAETRVAEARAALEAARKTYAAVNMRSPIAGTVYSVPVSAYDFVPAGDDLLDIADLTRIHVRAYFDEPEIGKLARGQAVKITWDAKPGMAWHGHVEHAPSTVIQYGTRSVGECLITVDDAKGDLLPNTNVTVTVTETQRFNVLSIPREALHIEGLESFVYRIVGGKLVRTPVGVGVVNLTSVEITSGLTGKDVVVLRTTSSTKELSNGAEVTQAE